MMDCRTRVQWGAQFDVSTLPTIPLPRSLIFVHHNVIVPTNDPNYDMLRTEQTDIARFGKPSYKWAVHPSGVVLEGTTNHRSPDTYGHNDDLSIMFMGNFEVDRVTDAAMYAGRELVAQINTYGWVTKPFQIFGHRDVYPTACPGANLYPRIQELLVPIPVPQPLQPKDDDMLVLQHAGGDFLLCGGKITPLDAVIDKTIPRVPCSDRQWAFFTKTFGVPVTD